MKRLGLLVHIRKNGGKSKMEALFIPPPDRDKVLINNTDQGYVTFNRRFTYLGSIITDDLEVWRQCRNTCQDRKIQWNLAGTQQPMEE
jgi:hypothetical protein